MDLGEYMRKLLRKQGTNISLLAREAGIRSKNEIYRLFNNQYSYDKAESLVNKILPFMDLTGTEHNELLKIMEYYRDKGIIPDGFKILEELYKDVRHDGTDAAMWLKRHLVRNDAEKITVFIGPEAGMDVIDAVEEALSEERKDSISVIHAVNFNRAEDVVAGELYALIKLIPYEGYSCYELAKTGFKGVTGFCELKNGRGVFIVNEDGEFADSDLSDELYELGFNKFSRCTNGTAVKLMRDKITNYAEMFTHFSMFESNDFLIFDGMFGFVDIPFGTMYKMFVDINYFGLPPDSAYAIGIVDAAHKRYMLRLRSDNKRLFVVSEERIKNFFKTGRTFDHVQEFKSLTKSEMYDMLEKFSENTDHSFRFFKQGYRRTKAEVGLVNNKKLFLWTSETGYYTGLWYSTITHPKVIKLFDGFAEYFWDVCTLPEKKSMEKMNKLKQQYI